MPKPERELVQAGRAVLAYVRTGELPPAGLMSDDRRPYSGLPGVKGGSANLGLVAHLLGLFRGLASSRQYMVERLTDCLQRGLQGGEQLSGYGDLHTGAEALAWWWCWREGDEELGSLLGASLERTALLHALCGRILPNGDLQLLAPGMRFDSEGPGRVTESAMWAHLLSTGRNKLAVREEEGKTWSGGLLLQALREAEGVERVMDRARDGALALLGKKDMHLPVANLDVLRLARIRLWCPMTWESYSATDFFALLQTPPGSTHPQDPAMPGGGVVADQARVMWPWKEGEDPGEGGWKVEVNRGGRVADVMWHRRGETKFYTIILPERPLLRLTFGPVGVEGLPAADPLGDLPPLPPPPRDKKPAPDPEPPPRKEEDEEEEPVPEEPEPKVPLPKIAKDPDLRWVQKTLQKVASTNSTKEEKHLARKAHRASVKLNLLGAWDWKET